jgi:5-amino-6-(5-phospho-D-ribitylamino)uracil phosphatase
MQYKMIAIDLDGTLLNDDGLVSPQNRSAIAKARDAGVLVVPCTGRCWLESAGAIEQMFGTRVERGSDRGGGGKMDSFNRTGVTEYDSGLHQPGVFVTGASVCDVRSGIALDLAAIGPQLTKRIVDALHDLPDAVLVFRDVDQVGHDYLITGLGEMTPNTRWWFEQWDARVHHQEIVSHDALDFSLRVGMVANVGRMPQVVERLQGAFDDELFFHHFEAIKSPVVSECMHILEIFAKGVDKWRGLSWLAQHHDFEPSQIAAIGDEINDVQMLKHAGCGVAMESGINQVKDVADRVAPGNNDHGVAVAIEKMLAGAW